MATITQSTDATIRAEHAKFGSVPDTSKAQTYVRPLEAMRRPDGAPIPHLADPGTLLPRRKDIITPDNPEYDNLSKRDRYVQGMVQLARQELAQQALVEDEDDTDLQELTSKDMVFSEVEGELIELQDLTPHGVPIELADLGDGLDEDEPVDMSVVLLRKGRGGPKPKRKKKVVAGRPKAVTYNSRLSDRDYSVEETVSIITRVKEKMALLHITHQDLADFMGCTKQAIWQWFKGHASPRPRQIDLMVRFLDTRVVSTEQVELPPINLSEGETENEPE
jgi:DNA-binding XRE family transcriptional regulator